MSEPPPNTPPVQGVKLSQMGELGGEIGLFVLSLIAGAVVGIVIHLSGLFPQGSEYGWVAYLIGPVTNGIGAVVYWKLTGWLDLQTGELRVPPAVRAQGGVESSSSPLTEPDPSNEAGANPSSVRLGASSVAEKTDKQPASIWRWPGAPLSLWASLAVLVVGFALLVLGSALIGHLMEFFGLAPAEQSAVLDLAKGGLRLEVGILLFVVSATVLAPVAEELFFRGLFFRRLSCFGSPFVAYGVSSMAFAAIHGNPLGIPIYAWLGVVFALSYRFTGRLWVAVLLHCANNVLTLTLLFASSAT